MSKKKEKRGIKSQRKRRKAIYKIATYIVEFHSNKTNNYKAQAK